MSALLKYGSINPLEFSKKIDKKYLTTLTYMGRYFNVGLVTKSKTKLLSYKLSNKWKFYLDSLKI